MTTVTCWLAKKKKKIEELELALGKVPSTNTGVTGEMCLEAEIPVKQPPSRNFIAPCKFIWLIFNYTIWPKSITIITITINQE